LRLRGLILLAEIKTVFAIWFNFSWHLSKRLWRKMVKKISSNSRNSKRNSSTNKKAMKLNNRDRNSNSSNILTKYRR
jgi:hypothetical protein